MRNFHGVINDAESNNSFKEMNGGNEIMNCETGEKNCRGSSSTSAPPVRLHGVVRRTGMPFHLPVINGGGEGWEAGENEATCFLHTPSHCKSFFSCSLCLYCSARTPGLF
jgi:hypothetical protein